MTKLYWILLIACAAAVFAFSRCAHNAVERAAISYENVPAQDWTEVELRSVQWKIEKHGGKSPAMLWSVRYTYSVGDSNYTGTHIDPIRDRVFVAYGHFTPQQAIEVQSKKTAWFNRTNPAQSVVFRTNDDPFRHAAF